MIENGSVANSAFGDVFALWTHHMIFYVYLIQNKRSIANDNPQLRRELNYNRMIVILNAVPPLGLDATSDATTACVPSYLS